MEEEGLRCSITRLSDRMSRSEMAVLLPSPPTALQVMITDIVDGIVESKNLHVLAACCKRAGWAPSVAAAVWHFHLVAVPCYSWSAGRQCLRLRHSVCRGR